MKTWFCRDFVMVIKTTNFQISLKNKTSHLFPSLKSMMSISLFPPPAGPAVPLPGWLEAPPAGHGAGQRLGLQHLPAEGGLERQPARGLRGQDAQQSPADQHNTQVCFFMYYCYFFMGGKGGIFLRIKAHCIR